MLMLSGRFTSALSCFTTSRRSLYHARRPGLLKFVDMAEKRDGKVGPPLFTRLIQKAYNKDEIKNLLQEAEKRFGTQISWQILASGAHRAVSNELNDPEFGAALLERIPKEYQHRIHEGVLRAVLGRASKLHAYKAAQVAYEILPFEKRTPTDRARFIHAGVQTDQGKEIINQVLSAPASKEVDVRVLGVFLKFCSKCHDIRLAERIWIWGEIVRKSSDGKDGLAFVTIQFLLLCGDTGGLNLARKVWSEAESCGLHKQPEVFGAMLSVLAAHGETCQTDNLLAQITPEYINAHMLTAVLTAYSHKGRAEEAWVLLKKFKAASQNYGSSIVGLNAYTCVVDAYARKGQFDSALEIIQKAKEDGITPDAVMWMTILSPCRHYSELHLAIQVFNTIKSLDSVSEEMTAASYVLMVDVYRECGNSIAAAALHKERLTRGLYKERGAVTTIVQGKTYTFYVNEIPVELAEAAPKIQAKLDEWAVWLVSQGVPIESIQCRHSEKLALAYAVCENEKNIILRKNLRVCSACHEASRYITTLENVIIHHLDRSRVHIMEDGQCSCGGFY